MPTPITEAARRLSDLLEKHPEMLPYARLASAGDVADLGKKLDGIIDLLQRIANEQARLADSADRPRAACVERVPFPETGQVEVEHIPGVLTTIRATLQPGMSLTLPPVPVEKPVTAEQADQIIKIMAGIDSRLVAMVGGGEELKAMLGRFVANRSC